MQAIQLDLFTGKVIEPWCDLGDDDYRAEDDLECLNPCCICELKGICTDGECACNDANFNLSGTRYPNLEAYIQELKLQGWWHPAKSYIVKH